MTPSSTPSPNLGQMIQQAIEGQIGTLTCQLIELTIRLRQAEAELAELRAPPEEAPPP